MTFKTRITVLITVLCCFTMVACGGSGNGSSSANTNTSSNTTETDKQHPAKHGLLGQYKSAQSFSNRCENPTLKWQLSRFIGTVTDENNWIRSWSHETYLWYNELPDIDPSTISDPIDYFVRMKTSAITASGEAIKTSFTIPIIQRTIINSLNQAFQLAMAQILFITSSSRRIFVTYTEPNSWPLTPV